MSKPHLPPDVLLEQLSAFAAQAAELARRQDALRAECQRRREQGQHRARLAREAALEQGSAEREAARTRLAIRLEAIDAAARARDERVKQAQRRARKGAVERVDAEEGRRKFELQREMLRATRERDEGLERAHADHAALLARLDALSPALTDLDSRTRATLATQGRPACAALEAPVTTVAPEPGVTASGRVDALETGLEAARQQLAAFRRRPLPALSRAWPLTLVLVLSPAVLAPVLDALGIHVASAPGWAAGSAAVAVTALVLHLLGRWTSRRAALELATSVARCRGLAQAATEHAASDLRHRREALESAHTTTAARCDTQWHEVLRWLEESRASAPGRVDARAARAQLRRQRLHERARASAQREADAALAALEAATQRRLAELESDAARIENSVAAEAEAALRDVGEEWSRIRQTQFAALDAFREFAEAPALGSAPIPPASMPWTPPSGQAHQLRFGRAEIDFPALLGDAAKGGPGRAPVPPETVGVPLLLDLPARGSLLLEAGGSARSAALGTLNHLVARALAFSPPGRVSFTFFDPVGLGQSFAGFTHLADEAGHVIDGRVWTQSLQLEERLAELGEHLEKVIQMYLRNDYPTIAEYNEQAGNIAERYRFLVLADFPAGFTEAALRRLLALATSGARCGVFILAHWDPARPLPPDFAADTLRATALNLRIPPPPHPPALRDRPLPGVRLHLDPAPDPADLSAFVHCVARASRESHRVEVPFEQIAPPSGQEWSVETATELRVPVGRTGATKLQYLSLGRATRQHVLIAGKTGSGKSTLFHVLITNLSLWCSPDEVEFYLVDFKKGVEFKAYATHRLPHARVVAIESDRDFGLSVLQRLDDELRRRGELFRAAGVQDLPAYRRSPGHPSLPRTLLLVDEFQEFFVEEDRIAQNASVLLDRIVRQGRAFGIHVVLGSQTLGGAYTVARSTLGQMVVRIALQCNEADALLVMDDDNPAPRLLSRPGEAIYNDAAGARSGNSPFQVVWLPDEVRDEQLRRIRQRAETLAAPPESPLVFEGDAPAEVRENAELARLLQSPRTSPDPAFRIWLGSPNSIKGPTEVAFQRRSADNLLAIGQRDDTLDTLLGLALVAIAASHGPERVRLVLFDAAAPSATPGDLERLLSVVPHPVTVGRPSTLGPVLEELAAELRARTATAPDPNAPPRFLLIRGLQHFRALRAEDEFSFGTSNGPVPPSTLFKEIVTEGPAHGIHTIATCDTWNTVTRYLGRKLLTEFSLRVLLQMSANDSASLIDSPAASRLGLHRALLYLDREGSSEIFRPYAPPDPAWLADARALLQGHQAV